MVLQRPLEAHFEPAGQMALKRKVQSVIPKRKVKSVRLKRNVKTMWKRKVKSIRLKRNVKKRYTEEKSKNH